MARIVIDNIDKSINLARIEIDGNMYMLPANVLPDGAKESDILSFIILNNKTTKDNITYLEGKLFK